MTERSFTPGPTEDGAAGLGHELRALRRRMSLTGAEFAGLVGWSQSRVSKVETGRKLCSDEELRQWLDVTRASPEDVDRIHGLHSRAYGPSVAGRRQDGNPAEESGSTGSPFSFEMDETASQISGVHPQLVPPILATADYLGSVFRAVPRSGMAQERLDSWRDHVQHVRLAHQSALYRRGTAVDLVLGEPALSNGPASVRTRLAQLDRLEELSGLANVSIGVVPEARLRNAPIPAAFTIRSPPLRVTLCGLTGGHRVDDADDVAVYQAVLEAARSAAEYGHEAIDVMRRTAQRIRADP